MIQYQYQNACCVRFNGHVGFARRSLPVFLKQKKTRPHASKGACDNVCVAGSIPCANDASAASASTESRVLSSRLKP